MMFSSSAPLVLASGSRYRKALLDQIGLMYSVCAPNIDESPRAAEPPAATARRLAAEKARTVAAEFPGSIIIGSDQVATLDGVTSIGKPMTHENAVEQLTRMSGQSVLFHTAVCVLNAHTCVEHDAVVSTEVTFRSLTRETIEAYLHRDQPYDCAGSARIESLGIAVVSRVRSDDPTALLGLPLIALVDLLAAEGIHAL
jgi:septum formation protein